MHIFNIFNNRILNNHNEQSYAAPLTTLVQHGNTVYEVSFCPPKNFGYRSDDEETIFKICKNLSLFLISTLSAQNKEPLLQTTLLMEKPSLKSSFLRPKKITYTPFSFPKKSEETSFSKSDQSEIHHFLDLLAQNLESMPHSHASQSYLTVTALSTTLTKEPKR